MGENTFIGNHTIFENSGLEITTNLGARNVLSRNMVFSDFISLAQIEEVGAKIPDLSGNVGLSLDKKNLSNYIRYGNASFFAQKTLETIILGYPGAIYSNPAIKGTNILGFNAINIAHNPFSNTTSFSLPTSYISNPLGVYFLSNPDFDGVPAVRNLTRNFLWFEVEANGTPYPIVGIRPGFTSSDSVIGVTVEGDPFGQNGNAKVPLYLRPKPQYYEEFLNSLGDLERYMLERPFRFYSIETTQDGLVLDYVVRFEFPRSDLYNLDVSSPKYESFYNGITDFFQKHDERYDILLKEHVPGALKSLTLEDGDGNAPTYGVLNQMFLVWGNEFDRLHQKIKNIRHLDVVSYKKEDSTPPEYIGALARTLGLQIDATALDAQGWSLLLANIASLWRSKGTRAAVEFLVEFFGIPGEILEYHQYEYVADAINHGYLTRIFSQIDPNLTLAALPVNADGTVNLSNLNNPPISAAARAELKNLIPVLPGYLITREEEKEYYRVLYSNDLNPTGESLSYFLWDRFLSDSACFASTGTTVADPDPTDILDVCGCPLPVEDRTLKICNAAADIYASGCTFFVLDVVPEIHISSDTYTVTGETTTYTPSGCESHEDCPTALISYTISYLGGSGSVANYRAQVVIGGAPSGGDFFATLSPTPFVGGTYNHVGLGDYLFSLDFDPDPQKDVTFDVSMTYTVCGCSYEAEDSLFVQLIPPNDEVMVVNEVESTTPFEPTTGTTETTITSSTITTYACWWSFSHNVYGGTPPYSFVGLQPTDILASGETYSVYAVDANGCASNTVSGNTICPDLCEGLDFGLSYSCQSGETYAVLGISVSGGTAPYTTIGAADGDHVLHGQTVQVYVEDATGCRTSAKSITVDCNPEGAECEPILLECALETTNVGLASKESTLTYSFSLSNFLPDGVETVTLTATGVGASDAYLVGTPVSSSFSGEVGAKQYLLDFDPESPKPVSLHFAISVLLSNGCVYSDAHVLSVDASVLNSTQEYTKILQ